METKQKVFGRIECNYCTYIMKENDLVYEDENQWGEPIFYCEDCKEK